MPEMEVAYLNDDAVVWEYIGDDRDGEPTIRTPYSISVRWDDSQNKTGPNAVGDLVRFDATIITEEDYPLGSIFWRGHISEIEDDPPVTLFRSVSRDVTNDIRGMSVERVYNLVRFNQELPAILGTG